MTSSRPISEHLNEPVLPFARRDFTTLAQDMTVEQALADIRSRGIGEKVIYFYVVDKAGRLAGVVPTRRLLVAQLGQKLGELMIRNVVAIPHTATVFDARECFALHKFFAFPLIDAEHRLVGVVDVGLLTDEVFDIAERKQMDEVFEAIGFRVSQVRDASPLRALRFRFPWLLTTIVSGTACALLAGFFQLTLAKSLVLAFFFDHDSGPGRKRQHPIHDRHHPGAARDPAGMALVSARVATGGGHRAVPGRGVRFDRWPGGVGLAR